jgi:hypothetical protein
MKLSSVGPFQVVEALEPEQLDRPVQNETIAQPQAAQLETQSENTPRAPLAENLTDLIEEAKKRAQARKQKGSALKRSKVLEMYKKIESTDEVQLDKGVRLDQRS